MAGGLRNFDWRNPINIYMIVVSVLVLSISGLYVKFIYLEKIKEVEILESELSKAERTLNTAKRQVLKKVDLEEKLRSSESTLDSLKEMFPDEENVPHRLQDLYRVIREAGVIIQNFSPEQSKQVATAPKVQNKKSKNAKATPEEEVAQYYREHYYKLELVGGYHMLGALFASVANFQYPTKISDMKTRKFAGLSGELEKAELYGSIPNTIAVSFSLTTYTSRK